ncbi:secretin N-terminal domain-containing protein [Planctomycetota bacterium]
MLSVLTFVGCGEFRPHSNARNESVEQKVSTAEYVNSEPRVAMRFTEGNEKVLSSTPDSGLIFTELHELGLMGKSPEAIATIEVTLPETEPPVQEIIVPKIEIAPVPNEGHSPLENNPQEIEQVQFEPCVPNEQALPIDPPVQEKSIPAFPNTTEDSKPEVPKTVRLILELAKDKLDKSPVAVGADAVCFENGDDVLELSLPETLTLGQLLDLAGMHLHLDYIYSPQTVGNQSVTLKLHGGLNGEMRIKDLYTLLETVLKFNGLAMIRREQKLVTIVPIAEALSVDPQLVDVENRPIQAGDTVLTRVFKLQYVNATSVTSLLQNMKLGVAVSTSEEARILFVTCYAHRMSRIEQMVNMIDRPGRVRECRFRRLQFTLAPALAEKVRALAQEIQGIPVTVASQAGKEPKGSASVGARPPVYLDTDERTNRLVMIGHEEQLSLLEELVDVLDVTQEDLHSSKIYTIKHMAAQEALSKLQEIDIVGSSADSMGQPRTRASGKSSPAGIGLTEMSAVVLDATNQLLVKATRPQHDQIEEFLGYIDVSPDDLRTLQVYEINHVDAGQVRKKLEELNAVGIGSAASPRASMAVGTAKAKKGRISTQNEIGTAKALSREPQVVVNESTNSLLVKATADQHTQIKRIIDYVDCTMSEEELSYKIYPLENSSPAHVADILERLIHETTPDKDGKVEKTTLLVEKKEQITIVPDPNTFSLIVYASQKNQEWIGTLTKSLDRRRPQVLIDVTLVEITRMDTFEYDLNLVANAKDAVIGNIGIDPIHKIDSKARIEGAFNMVDSEGNPTGQTKAFYSDKKVQALLTAIKRKNYGRVLAKPKILVDDGQQGEISTTDETTYLKEAIQIPEAGTPITTRDFEPVTASIQLRITPHIGEGDLLRLDVHLSRDDFGTRPQEGAPPDKVTSQVTTTVFVPDSHTVILGGLVKLNQSKGGSKVPILGDIPLVGGLFRSVDNSDIEKKLYVFLKANIVRPFEEAQLEDLQQISEQHQKAFEKSETEFQNHQNVPGIKPRPMKPKRVLNEL